MDPVEAAMAPDAEALHREKGVSRGVALAFLGLASLSALAGIGALSTGEIGGGGIAVAVALSALLVVLGVMVSVTRTVVTRTAVRWKGGLVSREIPLSAVEETSLQSYRAQEPVAVLLRWTEDGKKRAFSIASKHPHALRDGIDRARDASSPKARISAGAEGDQSLTHADDEEDRAAERKA